MVFIDVDDGDPAAVTLGGIEAASVATSHGGNYTRHVVHTLQEERHEWALVLSILMAMILLDNLVLRHCSGSACRTLVAMYYFLVAGAYGWHYTTRDGPEAGSEWMLGFWIEIVLSFDCLFFFHLIAKAFRVPDDQLHSVVFLGMPVALLVRLLLFVFLGGAVQAIPFLKVVLGLFLIYSGIQALHEESEEGSDVEGTDAQEGLGDSTFVQGLLGVLGSRQQLEYDSGGRIFVYGEDGRLNVSLLGPVLLAVEVADVIFAVDSFVAKATHMENMQAAFSSSAFAMWAVRALYFALCDMLEYFDHLKYGLCGILVFVGMDVLVSDLWQPMNDLALCMVVVAFFVLSMISSCLARKVEITEQDTHGAPPAEVRRRASSSRRSSRLSAVLRPDMFVQRKSTREPAAIGTIDQR
eukprot:TRINITY_DN11427_c0_g1_i2.p1 TRINITY_DN11427_c0_g1~~TRINITY_DN11427_c0_g1_i2.p1  ORF type:complete len:410 (-),score=101.74 TRINITY_DN11427_c0_g1_i2:254-1483(-)